MTIIAAVAIGRNEGERLVRCLASLQGVVDRIVYVDSGSSDDSVIAAQNAGAEVVELDLATPFTAARARNAGFAALKKTGAQPDYVQFIDGDCGLDADWVPKARTALEENPKLGIVTGWRSEINRGDSIYNAICDVEWHRPAGDIMTCGGDMMVRVEAFEATGGFNHQVIAAEDDEFCVRIRKAGWGIHRLPEQMTRHDAAMTSFGQWWRRAVRSGHGFAQVGAMHPDYFVTERRRVWLYGAVLPLIFLIGLLTTGWLSLAVLLIYGLSYVRTTQGMRKESLPWGEAAAHSVFLTLSKFPNFQGIVTYFWRQFRGQAMKIIEYK